MDGQSVELTLAMTRELPATRPVVFRAFVEPSQFAAWFGPKGYTISAVEFSPRVGERYRFEVQPPGGEHFHVTGQVREADPPSRLAFTFVYEPPSPDDVENLVGLSFRDLGGSTGVDLTQRPFKTEERRALHREGWSDSFDKLERFLSAQA